MKVLTPKNIKITFLVVLLTKLFGLMIGLLSQLLFLAVKMQLMNLLKQFLKSISTAKSNEKKLLIMSEEEEHLLQQSNSCWICEKLIDNNDEKVRDHCHVTGKFRDAAHKSSID